MAKQTTRKLDILHKLLPFWLRNSFTPLFQCIYLPCYVFVSPSDSDNRISMAYLGMSPARARIWAKRICGENYTESLQSPRIWYWQLARHLDEKAPDCQLVLVETCPLTERMLAHKPGFKIPIWIQLALDATLTFEQLKRASLRLRDEIPRTIRKYSLQLDISTNPDELDEFIARMHVPFISGRHQEVAFLASKESILQIFESSELLYITKDGERIAGVMLHCRNNIGSLHYIGVKDNKVEHLKTGCIGALYYFALLRSIEKGMQSLHFGGTSPFLTDSLTFFKLSFRPSAIQNTFIPDHFVKLMLRRKTPELLNFLQKNPFISIGDKLEFVRNVYVDSRKIESLAAFDDVFKKIACNNVAATRVYVEGDINFIRECLQSSDKHPNTEIFPVQIAG